MRSALLRIQTHSTELPFADHRRILLRGQELQSHHEGIVAAGEVVDPTLREVEDAGCLARGTELDVGGEFATGPRRLPRHEGVVLLRRDEAQGLLEALALASAPLRGGAVGIGDDLANPPPLLAAPGAAVRLLIAR